MTQRKRHNSAAKHWRRRVKRRDRWKCRICGTKENLTVHHIVKHADNEELRYADSNGLTVCEDHHEAIERGEIKIGP